MWVFSGGHDDQRILGWPIFRSVVQKMTRVSFSMNPKVSCIIETFQLVGGLEPWNFMTFLSYWEEYIIPTDLQSIIFQRGRAQPPTSQLVWGCLRIPWWCLAARKMTTWNERLKCYGTGALRATAATGLDDRCVDHCGCIMYHLIPI